VRLDDIDTAALIAQGVDRVPRALAARATLGVSHVSVGLAFADWWLHLATLPGKQAELARKSARKWLRFADYLARLARDPACAACIEPLEHDARFAAPAWQAWPFNVMHQAFLLQQQWWHNATVGVRGVSPHHEQVVNFAVRQMLDVLSPSNFPFTNPEVLQATAAQGGANFVRGAANFIGNARQTFTVGVGEAARLAIGVKLHADLPVALGLSVESIGGTVGWQALLIQNFNPVATKAGQYDTAFTLPAGLLAPGRYLINRFLTSPGQTFGTREFKIYDARAWTMGSPDVLVIEGEPVAGALGLRFSWTGETA